MKRILFVLLASLLPLSVQAQDGKSGQVQIPLELYNHLIELTRNPVAPPKPAPVNFALGNATVSINVASTTPRASAEVKVSLPIEIFESEWVLVPVLPPGTPVTRVTLQGAPVQLVATGEGLAWGTNVKGSYVMELSYNVDAASTSGGFVLALPVPRAASLQLSAQLPGTGLDVTVIPAAGVRTQTVGARTNLTATVPSTSGVQIAWCAPFEKGPSIGRALYKGELASGSIHWRAEFHVELFTNETATLPLLPGTLTLTSLSVDGGEAPILVEGKRFATLVRGQGRHTIVASFQTPVVQENGPPRTELLVPEVPVSRIELTLPGRKDVTASPAASVATRVRGAVTVATVHVPLTEKVALSWSEAIPEMARRELRANASIYHVIYAEEGVLYARAHVEYEVLHGGTNRIELQLPPVVEVNQVTSEAAAIADWRVETQGGNRILRVFLDRELSSSLSFVLDYDRSLGTGDSEALPLVTALGVGRQRGMVALVQTRDRALDPIDDGGATQVGENQLPAEIRNSIDRTVAHTFKYNDQPPPIRVTAATPERAAGRFDAEVDTLVSLGEVTVLSTASVAIHVKSGGLDRVDLELPTGANLLNLVAPSLRTHRVNDDVVEVEFTQEMEGDFRVEVNYERLLGENETEVDAATLRVRGADVEQGRIAIEASTAMEVAPLVTEELSPLDVRELPRQLVLRTTHPILHAFRYVRAEPAPRLTLGVTRHAMVAVQEAIIDRAEHRTLVTKDGLSVTTTRFWVRNTRKQFLRVQLPADSEIWSVFVAGKAEKPAVADSAETGSAFLVRIVSSSDAFPVEMVYATKISALGSIGRLSAKLARPDLLVTRSRWDLFLPDGFDYGRPSTNMNLVLDGERMSGDAFAREAQGAVDSTAPILPEAFHIDVPTSGIRYAFEMLYANHGEVEASLEIPYASRGGAAFGEIVSLLGVWLLYIVARLFLGGDERWSKRLKVVVGSFGALLALVPVVVYQLSPVPAFVLAAALLALSARGELKRVFERWRPSKTAEQNG